MKKWLRKIRGAIGMGIAWGLAWFAAGMGLLLIIGPDAADVPFPLGFGALGFFAGTLFSGIVSVVASRRNFDQISMPRFAGWGAAGGLGFSLLFAGITFAFGETGPIGALPILAPVFGLAGAGCASGALALARKANVSELPIGDADVSDLGLTDAEKNELLGDGDRS